MVRRRPVCWHWYETEDGEKAHLREADAEARGLSRCDPPERPRYRGGGSSAFVRGVHMSPEEREEVYNQTGRRVDDKNGLDRVFRETGLREAEKGEGCYDRFDALRDHAESGGPLDREHSFENIDLFGDYARRASKKPFDVRESFRRNAQKYGLDLSDLKP